MTDESETPPSAHSASGVSMSQDEREMWRKAAEDIRTPQVLARIADHNKAVISTVGTVGTLLAGLGGVTAAIAITRSTVYWHGIPVVPVGALTTSVLAGLAVGIALIGNRPAFAVLNTNDLLDVKHWYEQEVDRGKWTVRIASLFFIASAFVAAATSAVAGYLTITNAEADPRNLTALSATYGDKGAVEVHLAGAVDGLDKDEHLKVVVKSNAPAASADGELISVEAYPDDTGKVALDAKAQAPAGSTKVTATAWVLQKGEVVDISKKPSTARDDFSLTASYPKVPEPEKPGSPKK